MTVFERVPPVPCAALIATLLCLPRRSGLTRESSVPAKATAISGSARSPPLRTTDDLDALWDGIARGTIHVVATDHVAYTREEKLDTSQNVARHRAGMSNLQVMLPMLFSDGVRRGRISLDRFVEVTSTNPAKIFGLYPRKGVVAVGSDADLVLWIRTRPAPFGTRTCSRVAVIRCTRVKSSPGGPR